MYVVYVLDKDGKPLMPTKRFGKVRRMLKSGLAKAVRTKPFVIQLTKNAGKPLALAMGMDRRCRDFA